ncbi:hypothetical protein, partial [Natronomonas sp.]|uniref:hypothetical protein n=1 Tax=Natronomonas sp. TaxID=2184060 RepID=UPI0039759FAD
EDIPLRRYSRQQLIAQRMKSIQSNAERMAIAKEMFGIRSGKILGLFVNNLDSINENMGKANSLFAQGTELQRQYDVVTKSAAAKLKILKNNVLEVGITIGMALLPALLRVRSPILHP